MRSTFTQLICRTGLDVLVCSLATVFLLVVGCSKQKEKEAPMEKIPMKQISVDGINISYSEKGKGDPLVLVHGIPTSSFLWRNMIGELSTHGKVIALDLPGFGFSDPPRNGDYTISKYASLLKSFLESLSIEQATLVCHDYGGPIVLTYALKYPEKYKRLIILNTFLHRDLPPLPILTRIAKIRPIGELLMSIVGKSITRASLEQGLVDKSRISEGILKRYYMPDGSPDKLNASMLGTIRVEYMKDIEFIENNLRKIEKPTLILWGEDDTFLPLSLGRRIHKDIRGSKMETIPNCGHFVQEEKPEQATEIILEFIGG